MSWKKSQPHHRGAVTHRLERLRAADRGARRADSGEEMIPRVSLDMGWGRLLFAQTFETQQDLIDALRAEAANARDIAFYIRDPHVALATAPQEVFLDPSHTYRRDLSTYRAARKGPKGFFVRRLCFESDADAVNRIYAANNAVPVDPAFFWRRRDNRVLVFLIAEDGRTGDILGAITGVDHSRAFNDPERGSSLWGLAVDPKTTHPGVGEALVRRLAEVFQARGLSTLDLSVLHDNEAAIALYEKLGFKRAPFFTLKRKNVINEKLYVGAAPEEELNPYARIIVDEARRRGIGFKVLDAAGGFFELSYGGRTIICRESLSELTTAVAMARCADKAVTRRLMLEAGVPAPRQMAAGDDPVARAAFLGDCGSVVVKPAAGEQGRGVVVGITDAAELEAAVAAADPADGATLIEECVEGDDLRVLVINDDVVAAALRKPPVITGDGTRTVRELIVRLSRRREAATGGESTIPLDAETERALTAGGVEFDTVLEHGRRVAVRKTANLHTGGSLHDVTDQLHPDIAVSALRAARALKIPVAGLDFIVTDPAGPDHVFIEANERPGLANHEPQPTAERFVDLLFPLSATRASTREPAE